MAVTSGFGGWIQPDMLNIELAMLCLHRGQMRIGPCLVIRVLFHLQRVCRFCSDSKLGPSARSQFHLGSTTKNYVEFHYVELVRDGLEEVSALGGKLDQVTSRASASSRWSWASVSPHAVGGNCTRCHGRCLLTLTF